MPGRIGKGDGNLLRIGGIIALLWSFFIARGLFYITFIPIWEGFDEWAHYAVIQNTATRHLGPSDRTHPVSREVEATLRLLPWVDGVHFDAYWDLPEAQRKRIALELRSLPLAWATDSAQSGIHTYEAQQAPFYYWLCSPVYRLVAAMPFLTRVWTLRLFSLLLASTFIPFGLLLARRVTGNLAQATGIVSLVALAPQLMMTVCHIGNDSLAIAIGTLTLWSLFAWKDNPRPPSNTMILGLSCGLSLITKAYFLAFAPVVIVAIAGHARRRNVYRQACAVMACILAVSAPWYVQTWLATHSITGEQLEVAGRNANVSFFEAALTLRWLRVIDFAFLSHIWLGNWSFLVVRSWMYHVFAGIFAAAVAGLGLRMARTRVQRHSRADLLLLSGFYTAFLIALSYHAVRTFQASGRLGTFGYYLFPLIVAEGVLLTTGLEALFPPRVCIFVTPVLAICFAALEFFGTHFYAIPYYTGLIARLPNGNLHALQLRELGSGGIRTMVVRMTENKAGFLNPTLVAISWAVFLTGTSVLIGIALRAAFRRKVGQISDVSGLPRLVIRSR